MALNLTDYAANLFLNYPGAWYAALHNGDPGQNGALNEIVGLG